MPTCKWNIDSMISRLQGDPKVPRSHDLKGRWHSHAHVPDAALHLSMRSTSLQAGPAGHGQLLPLVIAGCHEQAHQAVIFL